MSTVKLTIDNRKVEVESGATILEASKKAGIKIPHSLRLDGNRHTPGACRVCMTEVDGQRGLIAACVFPVAEGYGRAYKYGKKYAWPEKWLLSCY